MTVSTNSLFDHNDLFQVKDALKDAGTWWHAHFRSQLNHDDWKNALADAVAAFLGHHARWSAVGDFVWSLDTKANAHKMFDKWGWPQ